MPCFDTQHIHRQQDEGMNRSETDADDSLTSGFGQIPGSGGIPAFTLRRPRSAPVPVLIAVPHAGRHYTDEISQCLRKPMDSSLRLEDRFVDLVAEAVARQTGAALLIAQAPRAMIDLNRSPDDIDWSMVAEGHHAPEARRSAGRRSRSGLGLVPRRLPGLGELWNAKLTQSDLLCRIEKVHQPYHLALARTLESMRDKWGAALLIDLHSMPPLGGGSAPAAQYVVGDRFGASCDTGLTHAALDHFAGEAVHAAHNRPYAGGYVLDRHGTPAREIHAMQLEICRSAYLDDLLCNPGRGMGEVVRIVTGMARRLAGEIAAGVSALNQAAE